MKKIFLVISLIVCWATTFSQGFTPPRSSSVITVQDSRWRALLNEYLPHTHGLTLNGGLDTLGMIFYEDSSGHVWYRDTVLGGGHAYRMLLRQGDVVQAVWGNITGSLINQTDLQNALNTKLSNVTNYIQAGSNVSFTGLGTLASPYIISSAASGTGTVTTFGFTNGNGFTGTVTNPGTTPNLSLGTSLIGIINGNGTGFGTVTIGSGLNYSGGVLTATGGTSLSGLIYGNGSIFATATIGAGLSFATGTLTNTINNTNQLTNGAGFITNATGLISAGTNVTITGSGTSGSPYVINSTGGGGGGGTVTSFSAGNLSPLFTTSVSNPSTIPGLTFSLSNATANSVFGNNTGSSAAPVYYVPTLTTLNGWASGSIALLGANQTFTGINTFGGGGGTFLNAVVTLGNDMVFATSNSYQIGTLTSVASHVFSRTFASDAAASLNSASGSSAIIATGGTAGITLLSTGQGQLNNYITPTSFTGTPTSILEVDGSGNIIQGALTGAATLQNVLNNGSSITGTNNIQNNGSFTFINTHPGGVFYWNGLSHDSTGSLGLFGMGGDSSMRMIPWASIGTEIVQYLPRDTTFFKRGLYKATNSVVWGNPNRLDSSVYIDLGNLAGTLNNKVTFDSVGSGFILNGLSGDTTNTFGVYVMANDSSMRSVSWAYFGSKIQPYVGLTKVAGIGAGIFPVFARGDSLYGTGFNCLNGYGGHFLRGSDSSTQLYLDTSVLATKVSVFNSLDSLAALSAAWSVSAGNVFLTVSTNSVGIGTSAPAVGLEVNRQSQFDSLASFNGPIGGTYAPTITVGGSEGRTENLKLQGGIIFQNIQAYNIIAGSTGSNTLGLNINMTNTQVGGTNTFDGPTFLFTQQAHDTAGVRGFAAQYSISSLDSIKNFIGFQMIGSNPSGKMISVTGFAASGGTMTNVLSSYTEFSAADATLGASATLAGFFSNITAGTNKYAIEETGNAANYTLGTWFINALPDALNGLRVNRISEFDSLMTYKNVTTAGTMSYVLMKRTDSIVGEITPSNFLAAAANSLGAGSTTTFLRGDGTFATPSGSGFSNPMTTAGDLIDATTGGTAQRLGIGSTGQVLQVVSGAPAWGNVLSSGTYVPTLTNTTNITSSSLNFVYYSRNGNIIHVMISGSVSPTTGATSTTLTFSLPFTTSSTTQGQIGIGFTNGNLGSTPLAFQTGYVNITSGTTGTFVFQSSTLAGTGFFTLQLDYTL